jgi:hypothetical protein
VMAAGDGPLRQGGCGDLARQADLTVQVPNLRGTLGVKREGRAYTRVVALGLPPEPRRATRALPLIR